MIEKWFFRLFSFVEKRKRAVLLLTGLVSGLSFWGLRSMPLDSSLTPMLPAEGNLRQSVQFIQDARFSDKIVLSFAITDDKVTSDDGFQAVDKVVGRLGAPYVNRVVTDFSGAQAWDDFRFFFENAPQILGPADLRRLDERLAPEVIEKELRQKYMQLMRPEGAFMSSMLRSDPLGLQGVVGARVQELLSAFGFDVKVDKGRLVSRDGRHTMVILETPVSFTDVAKSEELLDYLKQKLSDLPPGISVDLLCGHTHTVSNQRVIVSDIQITAIVEGAAFLVLFFVVFRDMAAVWIFMIPLISVLLALNIMGALGVRLSALTVGLGGVIAGVTVDYAIHVYTAIRHGRDRAKAVGSVVAPILLGAVTISCAFGAFLASSIEGYRQLGVFSIVGVGLAVVLALFVFPLLVKPGKAAGEPVVPAQWRLRSRRGDAWRLLVFLAICVAAAILATRVKFDSDIARLDGTARDILDSETRFRTVWGQGEGGLGMLAVTDADREQAAERYQQIHERAVAAVGASNVVSLATLWPSRIAREANLRNWANFWRGGREERLRKLLAEKGAPFSFAADAFDPFFEGLYRIQSPSVDPAGNMVFDQVRDRFIRGGEGRWSYILYFPDRPEVVQVLTRISAEHPGSLLVSRAAFMKSMSRVYSREIGMVTAVGMVLIVLAIVLGIRDFRFSCLALLPAAVGGLWLLGLMGWLGYAFTIGNLMAGIVVLGLCIDYGVLMVHGFRHGETRGPRTAVTMSAVTTVLGTGVLLFARHPVLFSVGLTLTVGVIAGYVAAILVLPTLNALWCGEREEVVT